ncbi:MAG TPA: FAD-linked oxidase C-terminal domain-containing protein [Myxococcota bacterium]|nr:FAD-linked oxidase C-terminal domain-containing protein [Myxococcota bacterium]
MLDAGLLKEIGSIVGSENLLTAPEELVLYGYDATPAAEVVRPDAVVLAGTAEEIAKIVLLANRTPFFVIPRGAGTGLTGGARPIRGGVVISTQRMNRILRIDADNLQAIVEPGVVTEHLQKQVEAQGFFYAPDPQSMATCTIGGNLAENAGGPRAVKYGVTRQSVLALQAVLPEGQLVRLGARTLKSVAGYDLLSLLLGSEGTLGIITEATLRLLPLPESRRTLLAVFAEVEQAAAAVGATFRAGVLPAAIEFMDGNAVRCVEDYGEKSSSGLPREAGAVLIIEVDGGAGDVERAAAIVERVMREGKAGLVKLAADAAEAESIWKARRAVGPALAKIAPLKVNEDIVVPLSSLPRAVAGIHSIAEENDIKCAIFGHAGDGNLHVNFLANPLNSDEVCRVERAVTEMFRLVISLHGSITGEHGVGTTKQKYLSLELSEESIDAMRAIKAALDPRGIMNPAKIFPERAEDGS